MPKQFLISEESARKLSTLARKGASVGAGGAGRRYLGSPAPTTADVDLVRIDDDVAVSGKYHATLMFYNAPTNTWEEYQEIWAREPNGVALTEQYYHGRRHGEHTDGVPVFTVITATEPTFVTSSGITAGKLTDNANASINTRGTTVSVTGTGFAADRWWVEAENNGVDYAQQTDPSPIACFGARFTKTTSTGKFLVAQWLKYNPNKFYNSRSVHVQFAAKASTNLNLRFGFLTWNGTADTITTPHFSAWGASGALPTPVANMAASIATIAVTTSDQNFSASNAGLSFANLAFVVWTDDRVAAGTWIQFTEAFLADGADYMTPYPTRHEQDVDACTYYGTVGGVFN